MVAELPHDTSVSIQTSTHASSRQPYTVAASNLLLLNSNLTQQQVTSGIITALSEDYLQISLAGLNRIAV